MSVRDNLDTRSKLRSSKKQPPPGFRAEDEIISRADDDPVSIMDNIWSQPYNENEAQLAALELRMYKQKRKVYEIQRVLQQNIDSSLVLLAMLHAALEEL
jgi:hypothetical protein